MDGNSFGGFLTDAQNKWSNLKTNKNIIVLLVLLLILLLVVLVLLVSAQWLTFPPVTVSHTGQGRVMW